MDKEARLSSARKKLKNFKRKREGKESSKGPKVVTKESSEKEVQLSTNGDANPKDIHIDPPLQSHSTASSTESIRQVSSTLSGILAAVESLTENGNLQDGTDRAASEYSCSSENISTVVDDAIKDLQVRNVELTEKLGVLEIEKEQLYAQCQKLTEQLNATKLTENSEANVQERLETQSQTIEILVSEKQDLQREVLELRSKAQTSNAEQQVLQETLQSYKKQLDVCESDLKAKTDTITSMEAILGPVQSSHEFFKEENIKIQQDLEREKLQTSELTIKMRMKDADFNTLLASHADLQERLNMAEVLLQQYSTRQEDATDSAKLEAENRRLANELLNSQLALEKLADEREHINKQHSDAQKGWESTVQILQSQIQSLQTEVEEKSSLIPPQQIGNDKSIESAKDETDCKTEVSTINSECQTENFFEEQIITLSNNNKQLSQLMQEKELRIQELEREVEDTKSSLQDHESLLDSARNDKVTISRALTQNKQLKEQLEEIQDSYVSVTNDKMDLATQLSSMESINKSLSNRLQEITNAFNITRRDLEEQKSRMITLQENSFNLPPNLVAVEPIEKASEKFNVKTVSSGTMTDPSMDKPAEIMQPGLENVQTEDMIQQTNETAQVVGMDTDTSETVIDLSVQAQSADVGIEENTPHMKVANVTETQNPTDSKMMAMLQQKFTSVMQERAELMNRIEVLEHANTQLQNECDTIGEYITLYHNQRQLLRQRHQEKDDYISTIIQEREEMRGKVEQLQTLVSTVLRTNSQATTKLSNYNSDVHSSRESLKSDATNADSNTILPQPDLVPKSDQSTTENVTYISEPHPQTWQESQNEVSEVAAQQIMNLLQQMQRPVEQSTSVTSRPSGFCMHYIGPYTAI